MRPIGWMALALAAISGTAGAAALEQRLARLGSAPVVSSIGGLATDPAVAEISGLAASRRATDRLWVLNDSDNGNLLHAISTGGKLLGSYPVDGATNYDWEDLAAFDLDGESWLLISDSGDNGGVRKDIVLYAVREPDPAAPPGPLPLAWSLHVRWPDGPRDCEAMAVDPIAREVLLLAKKRVPAQLFRVPLPLAGKDPGIQVAEQIAVVSDMPQPDEDDLARAPAGMRYMSQITSTDLAPDGLRLAVLTYREAYLFQRTAGEAWRVALTRPPLRLHMPPLVQAEAIAFDKAGRTLWIGTEKLPAPLIRLDPR